MMDVSDGLGADLPRLARASRCGFEVWPDALPCTKGRTVVQALSDGEDYELLFALAPRDSSRLSREWKKAFPRVALTQIGALVTDPHSSNFETFGYDHFTQR
jgi:thiamine-monophosphate kinase